MYPCHAVVLLQELCHALCILAVAGHTQVERFQTEVQQEGVLRAGNASEVTHELCHEFRHVGHLAKLLGIGQSVVRLVRGAETRELVGMGIPVEVTAIYHTAAYLRSMAVHIFRRRMCHDVCAPLEGTAVDGCGERVIHNQGHAVLVGDTGKLLDVKNLTARVRDSFTEERLRVRTESSRDFLLRGFLTDERTLNAELLQCHAKQVVRTAVDLV